MSEDGGLDSLTAPHKAKPAAHNLESQVAASRFRVIAVKKLTP